MNPDFSIAGTVSRGRGYLEGATSDVPRSVATRMSENAGYLSVSRSLARPGSA